jgi:hypothetical protein
MPVTPTPTTKAAPRREPPPAAKRRATDGAAASHGDRPLRQPSAPKQKAALIAESRPPQNNTP